MQFKPDSLRNDDAPCGSNWEIGGARRNRTADEGFADLCLPTWRPRPYGIVTGTKKIITKATARFLAGVAVVTQLAGGTATLDSVLTCCPGTGAGKSACATEELIVRAAGQV